MRKLQIILLMTSSLIYCQGQEKNNEYELTVHVKGIEDHSGNLMIAIFDNAEMFLSNGVRSGQVKADKSDVSFTFRELNGGIYAVSIYHDKNANGELDANFFGIPTEPYGFSNDAKGMFGPPGFEDCKFELSEKKSEIIINL